MGSELAEYARAYEEAFIAPFASHRWLTSRGRSHWIEMEGWQNSMAGPLSAIARTGGCEYVYHRGDSYFADVHDPAALHQRLLVWHAGLLTGLDNFSPRTSEESEDLNYMRSVAEQIVVLINWGVRIEEVRRATGHGSS